MSFNMIRTTPDTNFMITKKEHVLSIRITLEVIRMTSAKIPKKSIFVHYLHS